jgi:hypothetical protein
MHMQGLDPVTLGDLRTQTWERLEVLLRNRLAEHRISNDDRLDEVKTAHGRGRIAEIKELLALAQTARDRAKRGDAGQPPSPSSPFGQAL